MGAGRKRSEVIVPYLPRHQFKGFHDRAERFSCIVAHRRAGKTVACVNDLVRGCYECGNPNPRLAYIAPLYKQAKDVAWTYLKEYTSPIPGRVVNESELRVDFPNGGRVRLYGADNPDALRGIYLDGCILDEYADMNPRLWGEVVRPALSDRKGWCVFIGTPKGRNEFWRIWERARNDQGWFALMLRASETGIVDAEELALAARDMTPEQYAQEYECSFEAAIVGAYWGKDVAEAERAGRITGVPVDPALPVHTVWDLGIGDNTAIWFWQAVGSEIHVVDFYENSGEGLAHYAEVLERRGYKYGDDWVPHDARARELGTGRTRVEVLKQLRRMPRLVPDHRVEDGINAVRVLFPNIWIDQRCEGIEALRQYRAEYDDKMATFRDRPLHDWTSHAADAFRYLAMAYREIRPEPKPKDVIAEMLKPKTFDEVVAEYETERRGVEARI